MHSMYQGEARADVHNPVRPPYVHVCVPPPAGGEASKRPFFQCATVRRDPSSSLCLKRVQRPSKRPVYHAGRYAVCPVFLGTQRSRTQAVPKFQAVRAVLPVVTLPALTGGVLSTEYECVDRCHPGRRFTELCSDLVPPSLAGGALSTECWCGDGYQSARFKAVPNGDAQREAQFIRTRGSSVGSNWGTQQKGCTNEGCTIRGRQSLSAKSR